PAPLPSSVMTRGFTRAHYFFLRFRNPEHFCLNGYSRVSKPLYRQWSREEEAHSHTIATSFPRTKEEARMRNEYCDWC
ncbi:hypothetical protein PENTCL1PPCAC_23405, partial [Pristionchus entomophagus]